MMLASIDFETMEKMEKQLDKTFLVSIKIRDKEWKSKPAEEKGLRPIWSNSRVEIQYKDLGNPLFIEILDKDKLSGKTIAEGDTKVSFLVENGAAGEANVVLKATIDNKRVDVGSITFHSVTV